MVEPIEFIVCIYNRLIKKKKKRIIRLDYITVILIRALLKQIMGYVICNIFCPQNSVSLEVNS